MNIPKEQYNKLVIMANRLAGYYYSPVYLVGSVLTKKDFNDVDIVVIMSDKNFERRYGNINEYIRENNENGTINVRKKWAMDCFKRWEIISDFTGLNIDFKTQSITIAKAHNNKPFLRIDKLDCFN